MIINGTPENDNLLGTALNDLIDGGAGNDILNAGLGDDTLIGGTGNDLITFRAGQKVVDGGEGNDVLVLFFGSEPEDFVFTYNRIFEPVSTITGGILDGTEIQGIERVILDSGSGNDLIDIAVTTIGGRVSSGAGNDIVVGGSGDDTLIGESGDDTFFGGPGNDEIEGGAGNDVAVYVGLNTDYDVAIDEARAATVTGIALENFPDPNADLSGAEIFTDSLTDIEFILFDNGEIDVATGEFISFVADFEPERLSVYQFTRTDTQSQFYTTDENERDVILETLPQYELEGVSFVAAAPPEAGEDITGLNPVFRFFNTISGIHFFTADPNEKAFIEENLDNFIFEGTPYYSFDAEAEGAVPVYRFYNQSLDAHFYTISATERDSLIESPDYRLEGGSEGIAFYVEPASVI
ncbi:MAG: hypothetical protein AAFQ80_01985 [Cyanobacteria bacterium J06621_8]